MGWKALVAWRRHQRRGAILIRRVEGSEDNRETPPIDLIASSPEWKSGG